MGKITGVKEHILQGIWFPITSQNESAYLSTFPSLSVTVMVQGTHFPHLLTPPHLLPFRVRLHHLKAVVQPIGHYLVPLLLHPVPYQVSCQADVRGPSHPLRFVGYLNEHDLPNHFPLDQIRLQYPILMIRHRDLSPLYDSHGPEVLEPYH